MDANREANVAADREADRAANPEANIVAADVKQVIVIRRDLNMRRGKEIAQGSHASSAWLASIIGEAIVRDAATWPTSTSPTSTLTVDATTLDEAARIWVTTSHRKVTLQVRSEEELVALHEKAIALGLKSHLIQDSGKTEFGGVPTYTALGIGPNLAADIDQVTGELAIY